MTEEKPTAATPTTVTPPALPQRGVAGVVGAIAAGSFSALLAWAALAYGQTHPLLLGFTLLIPIPLFAAGLGIGRSDVLLATLVSMAGMAWFINIQTMMMLAAVFMLPVLLLCLLALRHRYDEQGVLYWYPAGRLITGLVLYPLAVFGVLSLVTQPAGVEKALFDLIQPMIENVLNTPEAQKSLPQTVTPDMISQVTGGIVAFLPGMTILSWITTIIVSALWVQFVLMGNRANLRPVPHLQDFDIPAWLLIFFAIMALIAMFFTGSPAYYARNTLLPLSLPYFVLGTTLVHLWANRRKSKTMLLAGYYFIVFMTGWPMILVALIGVLEPWLHLRRRITQTKLTI